jgi:Flp pilus assembly pilin Flp
MRWWRRFSSEHDGLATIEYVIGAAVILGTLVIGVSAWNNGLVARLQALVTQLQTVR